MIVALMLFQIRAAELPAHDAADPAGGMWRRFTEVITLFAPPVYLCGPRPP